MPASATRNGKVSPQESKARAELAAEIVARALLHCERLGVTIKINEGWRGTKVLEFQKLSFQCGQR